MDNVRDIINFMTCVLQRWLNNYKCNSNMHLLGCWSSPIIFTATSICKCYVVKFILFRTFSYLNYFLWLMTHLFIRFMYLNLYYLLTLPFFFFLPSSKWKKNVQLKFFFISNLKKKNHFLPPHYSLSVLGPEKFGYCELENML